MDDLAHETMADATYFELFFEKIKQLKKRKHLCDIQVVAKYNNNNEIRYPAHKVVLVSGSPYLAAHIDEIEKKKHRGDLKTDILELDLRNHRYEDFISILDYLYTGKVNCTITNVISLIKYSDLFELRSLKPVLIEFMKKHVTGYTWLNFWRFSETQNCLELTEKCENFGRKNLDDTLNKNLEILKLKELLKIVKGYKVDSENECIKILKYIINWIQVDEGERFESFFTLTKWNTSIQASALVHLYHNRRPKLQEFIKNLTFNKLQELSISTNEDNKIDPQILYSCIKEWFHCSGRPSCQQFELLKLIDLNKIDKEFLKMEMLVERFICENPKIETYVTYKSGIHLQKDGASLKNILLKLQLTELLEIVKSFSVNSRDEIVNGFSCIVDWVLSNAKERLQYLFELTEWNTTLMAASLSFLFKTVRSYLEEFLRKMPFHKMEEVCAYETESKNIYICTKEWIYLCENDREKKFEKLLKLIDLNDIDREFLKNEISTEKLIYENQNVKELICSIIMKKKDEEKNNF